MTDSNQRSSLLGKIAAYTEILNKDPGSTIFVSLGEAYRKMGMLDDALQVIENGLEKYGDFSPAYIVRGRILCQQGDYAGSEQSFEQALQLDPDSLAALVGYARLKILIGQEPQAREVLLRARAISPADPVINKLLLSLPEPDPVKVEEPKFSDSEEDEPISGSSGLASATLAELYLKQGLEDKALEIYRQLSLQDPNNLVLRRQIRDLEDRLGIDSNAVVEPADVQSPTLDDMPPIPEEETLTVSEPGDDEEIAPEGDNPSPEESFVDQTNQTEAAEADDQNRILGTLNCWLSSIQQRRSDV